MKYFKRIKDNSLERYGIYVNKIYKENKAAWKDGITIVTVAQSHNDCPNNWKEVSEIDYIEQEGWYIKGSEEFGRWLENNKDKVDSNMYNGESPDLYYIVNKSNCLNIKNKYQVNRKIEITVDQLNEIYSVKSNKQMQKFEVEVNKTTSRILQQLAFENGWSWRFGGKSVKNLCQTILVFEPYSKDISMGSLSDSIKVSLEEIINKLTTKEESLKKGDYVVVRQKGHEQEGNVTKIANVSSGSKQFPIRTRKISGQIGDIFQVSDLNKATDEQVKVALINEAERRGLLKKGSSIHTLDDQHVTWARNCSEFKYNPDDDSLYAHTHLIYRKGGWAEIDNTIFGFPVEKRGRMYKFGCADHQYTKDELERVVGTLSNLYGDVKVRDLFAELRKLIRS